MAAQAFWIVSKRAWSWQLKLGWETAQIHGAAHAQFEQQGLHPEPADEAFLDPLVAQAHMALGTEAFAAAQAAGRLLTYDAAMAELRAWLKGDSVTLCETADVAQDRGGATAMGQ